eukprot:TRINITY_DN1307_c2_g1_i1.p1 TRINITY_DN1307_c2_g1~~TRINITY_DN1307_c2_g1_i1.p1  ORF type:complete len:349 (+),score=107.88 TRINITY_DN1307_c2_g1_i1:58-1104(+)
MHAIPIAIVGVATMMAASMAGAANLEAGTCCPDWAKCGGKNWTGCDTCCNSRFFCNASDPPYYSECVPKPLVPFPPAPASEWCGPQGKTLNKAKLAAQGVVSSEEIAQIWSAATKNLTLGFAPGGPGTCVQAVSIALGECGHPSQSNWKLTSDPVCSFDASGAGGIWQVTSQDSSDTTLAGCSDGTDPCCNARLAYAHAYNQGGATVLPEGYCSSQSDCSQLYSDCGGKTGKPWNNRSVDLKVKVAGATIPSCSYKTNPWYPDGGVGLANVTVDQEPCYWGPFSVAAGGVGKEFFPGFYGWGGFFQHYLNSKAGMCDYSPQCVTQCDPAKYTDYPSYIDLALGACGKM